MLEFKKGRNLAIELKAARFLTAPIYPAAADDSRFHINHIKVEQDSSAVGTDGCRMHHVSNFQCAGVDVPPGFYAVRKRTKTVVWLEYAEDSEGETFPSYSDIMEMQGKWTETLDLLCTPGTVHGSFCQIIRLLPNDEQHINFYYFADLCDTLDGTANVTLHIDEEWGNPEVKVVQKPIHFKRRICYPDNAGTVVFTVMIMPIR